MSTNYDKLLEGEEREAYIAKRSPNQKVYTVTAVYSPSGEGQSADVQAICTTREAAEAMVERVIREDVLAGRGWIGQDWSYRVDEYPLCITPNEARTSRKVAGEDIYYDEQTPTKRVDRPEGDGW